MSHFSRRLARTYASDHPSPPWAHRLAMETNELTAATDRLLSRGRGTASGLTLVKQAIAANQGAANRSQALSFFWNSPAPTASCLVAPIGIGALILQRPFGACQCQIPCNSLRRGDAKLAISLRNTGYARTLTALNLHWRDRILASAQRRYHRIPNVLERFG
jgi:hypothetical protein